MEKITVLNNEEFVKNSNFILNVKLCQHLALQKILEINFDLEKFVGVNRNAQDASTTFTYNENICSVSKIEEACVVQGIEHDVICKKEFSSSPQWESSSDLGTSDQSDYSAELLGFSVKTAQESLLNASAESFVLTVQEDDKEANIASADVNMPDLSFVSYIKPAEECSNSADLCESNSETNKAEPNHPDLLDKIQKYKTAQKNIKPEQPVVRIPDLSFKPSNTPSTATKEKKKKASKNKKNLKEPEDKPKAGKKRNK